MPVPKARFGERNRKPLWLDVRLPEEDPRWFHALAIPGVKRHGTRLYFGWDTAAHVCGVFGVVPPPLPPALGPDPDHPGYIRYRELNLQEVLRLYQKLGVQFLFERSGAILADPMRSGKTLTALAAATLIDARKVCICVPAIAKREWARQALRWLGETPLILEGRSNREAWRLCRVCEGTGRAANGEEDGRCAACKMRNGQSLGYELFYAHGHTRKDGDALTCPVHHDQVLPDDVDPKLAPNAICPQCQADLWRVIATSRFVITNYELLVTQRSSREDDGSSLIRHDMPGWTGYLLTQEWDLIIGDEAHMMRTRTNWKRRGENRVDRFEQLTARARRVWLVTGTPIYAYTRDIYRLLDLCMPRSFGFARDFDIRYCEGREGEYAWENKGSDPVLVPQELNPRLSFYMLYRERKDIDAELPEKQRQAIYVEPPKGWTPTYKWQGSAEASVHKAIEDISGFKREASLEHLLQAMMEGEKVVVFTSTVPTAKWLHKQVRHAIDKKKTTKARLQKMNAEVWHCDGSVATSARDKRAVNFVNHTGAAAFIATVQSFQVALSLKTARTVMFVDMHHSPAEMLQAEDRAYDADYPLTVLYFLVQGSVDDHLALQAAEKAGHIEGVTKDSNATAMRGALTNRSGEQSSDEDIMEDLWAQLTDGWTED